jgi:integrase
MSKRKRYVGVYQRRHLYYGCVTRGGKQYWTKPGHRLKEEAYKDRIRLEIELDKGKHFNDANIKLKNFVEGAYTEDYVRAKNLSPNTIKSGIQPIKNHVYKFIGNMAMKDVTYPLIKRTQDHLLNNMSSNSARVIMKRLRHIFKKAVTWGLISDNPTLRVELPATEEKKAVIMPLRDYKTIMRRLEFKTTADDDPTHWNRDLIRSMVIIQLAFYQGLRRGEIFGLQWNDIDFEHNTLTVNRQYTGSEMRPPKTRSSYRTIPMQSEVRKTLKRLLNIMGGEETINTVLQRNDVCVIFRWDKLGKPLNPTYWIKSVWMPLQTELGLPVRTLHSLRHLCATVPIREGNSMAKVQQYMGHANISITVDIYSHLELEDIRDLKIDIE